MRVRERKRVWGSNLDPGLHRKKEVSRNFLSHLVHDSISFFFTNFPESHGTMEMWKFFSKWGTVGDVFIPHKRDKMGRKFGFVRFKRVVDGCKLKSELSNVSIGLFKVIVNTPRFQRQALNSKVSPTPSPVHLRSLAEGVKSSGVLRSIDKNGSSWKQVLLNGGSLVGELERVENIFSIQKIMAKEGYLSVKTIPTGGRWVLLKGNSDELLDIQKERNWSYPMFKSFCPWSQSFKVNERLMWVKCFGVPIQAWSEEFFRLIAAPLGTFVMLVDATREMNRLDVGGFLVLTDLVCSVDLSQKVRVDGVEFIVRLVESFEVHSLGCLEVGSCSSRISSSWNQVAEVHGDSDFESWQDRDSCWGENILMNEEDDEVADSLVNELSIHHKVNCNPLSSSNILAFSPVVSAPEGPPALAPIPLPILESSLSNQSCGQKVLPSSDCCEVDVSEGERLEKGDFAKTFSVSSDKVLYKGDDSKKVTSLSLAGSLSILKRGLKKKVGLRPILVSESVCGSGLGGGPLKKTPHFRDSPKKKKELKNVTSFSCFEEGFPGEERVLHSKTFANSVFEVGASSKAFKCLGNKSHENGAVDVSCNNTLGNLTKDRGKKLMASNNVLRIPSIIAQVQRKKKFHPPLVLK